MNYDSPFFMNFNMTDFMSKFAVPGMDNEYTKKLMSIHKKNLDAYVSANKVVSEGYRAIATKQMEIFQEALVNMNNFSSANQPEAAKTNFESSTKQMQELMAMATKTHQEAFEILSARTNDLMAEIKV